MSKLFYFLFEIKRCFRKTGQLFLAVIILSLICTGIFTAVSHSSNEEPAAAPFTIVVSIPENAGLHYNLAIGMISRMDSFQSMCTVITTDSEEKAAEMLENGKAKVAVLIPEGLIHSVLNGGNLPARIIYPSEPSLETVLFRNLVDSLAHMLSASQSGVYALYDIYADFGISEEIQAKANSALNNEYISLVFDRNSLFIQENISEDGAYSYVVRLISGGLSLLFLLGGICLCDCLCPLPAVLSQALKRIRIGHFSSGFSAASGAFITQYLLYCLICLCAFALEPIHTLFPGLSADFLPVLAACIFFAATFQLLICRIFRYREAAVIGLFFIAFILIFCAGGLLPSAFLPAVLRKSAPYNPVWHLQNVLAGGLNGVVSSTSIAILIFCGILFIVLSAGIDCLIFYQKHSSADRSDLRTLIHSQSASRFQFSIFCPKTIPGLAWILFLAKRTLRRPIYWILSALILFSGFAAHQSEPSSASIPVGIFCENPDSFTSSVIENLLSQPSDRLYRFYTADSEEMLKEDILWGRAECGYVFPDTFHALLMDEEKEIIRALSGSSSMLTELVHEEIYATVLEAWAPFLLADYIENADAVPLSGDTLWETVEISYLNWLESGNTFYVEYEDVDESFFRNDAAFELPLRGIFALILFCAVMAGMTQYRQDKARQLFLVRNRQERYYLPVICCVLPAILPAITGLICLYLNGQSASVLYELAALITYLTALTFFASVINCTVKSILLFDVLIPILIIFCVLYAPVITDLSSFLPAGNILSRFAPANWYLFFF